MARPTLIAATFKIRWADPRRILNAAATTDPKRQNSRSYRTLGGMPVSRKRKLGQTLEPYVWIAPSVILMAIFIVGGLQLFFSGFLGEYIMAMNTRIMKRPLVIEEERINFD